ncbi:MAG: pentapeptide repeat-containing protein [Spirochaetales bacterium]|nr:pentapeptide repeat-containing protein [Spirochaetales bacterium]
MIQPHIKTSTFNDPGWYLNLGISLVTLDKKGIAESIFKALEIDFSGLKGAIRNLYEEAFHLTIETFAIPMEKVKARDTEIDPVQLSIRFPTLFPLFYRLVEKIRGSLEQSGIPLLRFKLQFDIHFKTLLDKPAYTKIVEFQRRIQSEESDELQLLRHVHGLLHTIDSETLPLVEDSSLVQVYTPPTADYYEYRIDESEKKPKKTKAGDVIFSLIDNIEKGREPIILHGEPGHGKTSTMKMLVRALSIKNNHVYTEQPLFILFFEFKHLRQLNRAVHFVIHDHFSCIKEPSFFTGKRVLMIFDGMDEKQATADESFLNDFVKGLFHLSARVNKESGSQLNIVLTGRTQFFLPMRHCLVADSCIYELDNFSDQQTDRWLAAYFKATGKKPEITREQLRGYHLTDLIKQPILLTICTTMISDILADKNRGGDFIDKFKGEISISKIYAIIVDWTYKKRHQSGNRERGTKRTLQEFKNILYYIALSVFHHSENQQVRVSHLVDHLCKHPELKEAYNLGFLEHDRDKLTEEFKDIVVLFYFKGTEDWSIEFAHKSIHDYLVVDATIFLLCNIFEGFNLDRIERSCNQCASELYELLGKTPLHPDSHLRFLQDMVKQDRDMVMKLIGPVTTFLEKALDHIYLKEGLHLHKNPLKTEAYIISGLFYLVTTILGLYADDEEITTAYGSFIREKINLHLFIGLFNSIEEFGFLSRKFIFYRIDLSEVDLRGEILERVQLTKANLREVNLNVTYLCEANLKGARLVGANLRGANLVGTNLVEADLAGANLAGARLVGANLRGANLRGANLKEAILEGANLQGAILEGAILKKATYTKGQLKKTIGTPWGI